MDDTIRFRLDVALVLLAVVAGSTAVAAAGVTDGATVAAGVVAAVLPTVAVLFVRTGSV